MVPNMDGIKAGDRVWYKGLEWTVRKVRADLAVVYRDGENGRVEVQGELMHMSLHVPMNEREEPPNED